MLVFLSQNSYADIKRMQQKYSGYVLNGKELIGICNFGRNFIDLKIHLILKFSKIKLVQISNIGNIQWSHKFLKTSLWTKIKFRLNKFYLEVTSGVYPFP